MTSRGKRKPRYGFDEIVMPRRLPRTGTRRQADNAQGMPARQWPMGRTAVTARYKQKGSVGSLAACPGRKRAARLQAAIVAPADGADRALVQAGRRSSPVSRVTGSTAGTDYRRLY